MEIKVSVVVPAYNAQKTLAACLGNLVNQTLEEIEIILVDDCSKDGTLSIMQECQSQFLNKVRVLCTDVNRGPGGARNLGIKNALGHYIGFVDSDDLVDITMYEKLYKASDKETYDVVDCGYHSEQTGQSILFTSDLLRGELNVDKRRELIVSGGYVVTKLFRRSLIEKNEITFRENATLEDLDFWIKTLLKARSIWNVKEILYVYKDYADSLSKIKEESYYENALCGMKAIYEAAKDDPDYVKLQEAVEYPILQIYSYLLVVCLQQEKNTGFDSINKIKRARALKNKITELGCNNPYVRSKISPENIQILELAEKI